MGTLQAKAIRQDGPGASNPESEAELSDVEDADDADDGQQELRNCALAHIKARRITEIEGEAPEHIKAMVTSWEQYKIKYGNTASTSYHRIEDADAEPVKKHKSVMIDTGADITLMERSAEPMLSHAKDSRIRIEVADKNIMFGGKDGTAHMHVLQLSQESFNLTQRNSRTNLTLNDRHVRKEMEVNAALDLTDTGIVLSHRVTTVDNLSRELFSVDGMFTEGCSIQLRAPEYSYAQSTQIFELCEPIR